MKPSIKKVKAPAKPLHIKYRPKNFSEVIGQAAVVRSLKDKLGGKATPHAYLFTGPSGCGKTTLARIIAGELKCHPQNIVEIDAATHSGIDNMREITSAARYKAIGESSIKVYIIDECHALTKATWQSLLLSIEEPPEHVFWVFCTTEIDKVPQTIKTRCHSYDLKPVHKDEIYELLESVVEEEDMELADGVLDVVASKADGSVRQALVYLSTAEAAASRQEAYQLLNTVEENGEIIDLVRFLVAGKGTTWPEVMKKLEPVKDQNPESIRLVVVNYLSSVLQKAKNEKEIVRLLSMLEAFGKPYYQAEKMAPLLLSIGVSLFQE